MNPAVKKRAVVWAAWAACVLVAALTVAAVVVDFLPGQSQRLTLRIQDWSFTAVAVPFAAVGALIVVHRPGNHLGGLLLVGALAIGVEKLAQELVQYGVRHPGAVPALEWIGWVSNWAWVPAILMILLLPALFPDGQPLSPRWRPLVWAMVAGRWSPSSGRRWSLGLSMRPRWPIRSGCPVRRVPGLRRSCRSCLSACR